MLGFSLAIYPRPPKYLSSKGLRLKYSNSASIYISRIPKITLFNKLEGTNSSIILTL